MVEISTSVLSVKKEGATKTFYNLEIAHTDYFHIDLMDGKFVKNNTEELMLDYANTIKQISNIPLDIHLMVENVKEKVDEYIGLNPNIITFHLEACKNSEEVLDIINYIKENNIKVGIAIKPDTKIEEVYEFLPLIHMCLVMTVEPGEGGQKLIPETVVKIDTLKKYISENNIDIDIEADGGIDAYNSKILEGVGVNILVVGTAIISAENYQEEIKKLK